jgi:hypothetical protein
MNRVEVDSPTAKLAEPRNLEEIYISSIFVKVYKW